MVRMRVAARGWLTEWECGALRKCEELVGYCFYVARVHYAMFCISMRYGSLSIQKEIIFILEALL